MMESQRWKETSLRNCFEMSPISCPNVTLKRTKDGLEESEVQPVETVSSLTWSPLSSVRLLRSSFVIAQ